MSSKTNTILLAIIAASLVAIVILLAYPRLKKCEWEFDVQRVLASKIEDVRLRYASEGWEMTGKSDPSPADGARLLTFKRCKRN